MGSWSLIQRHIGDSRWSCLYFSLIICPGSWIVISRIGIFQIGFIFLGFWIDRFSWRSKKGRWKRWHWYIIVETSLFERSLSDALSVNFFSVITLLLFSDKMVNRVLASVISVNSLAAIFFRMFDRTHFLYYILEFSFHFWVIFNFRVVSWFIFRFILLFVSRRIRLQLRIHNYKSWVTQINRRRKKYGNNFQR